MPSSSKKQHNFMEAIAHNPAFAKKVGIPRSVGEDFVAADKGKHFKKGGMNMKKRSVNPAMAMMAARAMQTPQAPGPQMAPPSAGMAPQGAGMKRGGKTKKYASGGSMKMKETVGPRNMNKDVEGPQTNTKFGESKVQKRSHTDGAEPKMKTGGKVCKMANGGMAKFEKSGKDVEKKGMKEGSKADMALDKKQMMGMKKMAGGGSTSSRADGIAQRGKTKTKYC